MANFKGYDKTEPDKKKQSGRTNTGLKYINYISVCMAIIVIGFGVALLFNYPPSPMLPGLNPVTNKLAQKIDSLQQAYIPIEQEFGLMYKDTVGIMGMGGSVPLEIIQNMQNIEDRLSKIENVILSNPSKSLNMVLIQKDIADLQEQIKTNMHIVQQEITRVYNYSWWALGLLVTTVSGFAVYIVGNIYKSR